MIAGGTINNSPKQLKVITPSPAIINAEIIVW